MVVLDAVRAALRGEIQALSGIEKNIIIEELLMAQLTAFPGIAAMVAQFEIELIRLPEDHRAERLKRMVASLVGSMGPTNPLPEKTAPPRPEVA